ncbi:MAG: DUF1080 domain-containing protein [Planctomycetota bacterium]
MKRIVLAFAILLTGCLSANTNAQEAKTQEATSDFVELFNGKDFDGWTQKNGTAKYTIEEGGVICGETVEGSPNSFLCTEKEYGDFELTFDVKVDDQLNSGVQIRSKEKPAPKNQKGVKKNDRQGRVFGPQVEIEASGNKGAEAGYVYGEATGRGWLVPKEKLIPHKHFKDGEWNSYRVIAKGPNFHVWINGTEIIDLTDEEIFKTHPKGFIGLQVHSIKKGTGPFQVRWKNIKLREIK